MIFKVKKKERKYCFPNSEGIAGISLMSSLPSASEAVVQFWINYLSSRVENSSKKYLEQVAHL